MKKAFLLFGLVLFVGCFSFAQKFAYVDTEYILSNIPTYKAAKAQLDELSVTYQSEIETAYEEVEKMYQTYQVEKVLLTNEMQLKREDEIIAKEKAVKELKKKYFGQEGELFKKRQELIKPIQDEIFKAVQEIAEDGNIAMIFDISDGGISVLYTDSKYDKSDEVLKKLGYGN